MRILGVCQHFSSFFQRGGLWLVFDWCLSVVVGLAVGFFGGFGGGFFGHFFVALFHGGFAAEANPAFVVDFNAFDPNFVAEFDDVFGSFDAEAGQLADVAEAVLAGKDFDKAAKVFDGGDFASVDFFELDFGGEGFDFGLGDFEAVFGKGVDFDFAIVFDIDFATGFFDESFDVFSSGADEGADFVGIDENGGDFWGVRAEFFTRLGQCFGHLRQDLLAGHLGLG